MKIKDLAKIDWPRERLEKYGPEKLADHELLAILLGSGVKGLNVLVLAKRILKIVKENSTRQISVKDLSAERGLGRAKAAQIVALLELGKRLNDEKPEILSTEDVWKMCADIRVSKKEHFVAFYLDAQDRLVDRQVVSIGTLSSSLVHPREVFEPAVRLSAASVIVAHNHPSGNLKPSEDDIEITKQLIHAGKILDISLVDHVIVVKNNHTSIIKNYV